MRSGSPSTPISQETVRLALETMRNPITPERAIEPLRALWLVEEIISSPEFPFTIHARDYAVDEILSSIIVENLGNVRRLHKCDFSEGEDEAFDEAVENITSDAQRGSSRLTGWGLLYYCYVRVDFEISLSSFAMLSSLTERTVRRYRDRIIAQLTDTLITVERQARKRARFRRLCSQLPESRARILLERTEQMGLALKRIGDHFSITICIHGPPGIGKTTFAQELLRQFLYHDESVENLCWLDSPETLSDVKSRLRDGLLKNESTAHFIHLFRIYKSVIVIDDADKFMGQGGNLRELNKLTFPSLIILTASRRIVSQYVDVWIELKPLSLTKTQQMLEDEATKFLPAYQRLIESPEFIYEKTGGNPLAIRLFAQLLRFEVSEFDLSSLDHILQKRLEWLDEDQIHGLLALSLSPQGEPVEDVLKCWFSGDDISKWIDILQRNYLIDVTSVNPLHGYLPVLWRSYITQLATQTRMFYDVLLLLIYKLDINQRLSQVILRYIARHLTWSRENSEIQRVAIHRIAEERYKMLTSPMRVRSDLMYASGLLQIGDFEEASSELQSLLHHAETHQDNRLYGYACLELSIIHRLQSQYESAISYQSRSLEAGLQQGDDELCSRAALEGAQLAVDIGNRDILAQQLSLVKTGYTEKTHYKSLKSELMLIDKNYEGCRNLAYELFVNIASDDRSAHARIHDLIGRSYFLQTQYINAERHFATAVTYARGYSSGSLLLGRSLTNRAACLLHLADKERAEVCLREAENIQDALSDRAGLVITRANLRELTTVD